MVERFYTLAEASRMLPQLTRLLEEMRAYGQQLAAVQARQAATLQKIKRNGHHNPTEDTMVAGLASQLDEALREGIAKLAEWNIQLKDLATGLIDFPALREGRTVFLCWQLGESEIAYWHETDTGYAGRQPLDDLIP